MSATIGGVDLGIITSESSTKSSNLFNQPMPLSDSDESILQDLLGTSRTITVEGRVTGELATLQAFIVSIEGIQNGEQSGSSFVSSWTGQTKTVLIQDFTHTKLGADENEVNYTLTLTEGTVL